MSGMEAELVKLKDVETARRAWHEFESACNCSVFQSWAWIGPWLERAIGTANPWLLAAYDNGHPAGVALAIEKRFTRNHLFPVKALFINEAGPELLDFCIEYNGFLLRPGREQEALKAMFSALCESPLDWDEVHVRRISETAPYRRAFSGSNSDRVNRLSMRETNPTLSRYIDLAELRANNQSYSDSLSASRRKKIRRELRIAEKAGPLKVECAETVDNALALFGELKDYHQLRWERSGESGSFADPAWESFHRELITEQIPRGGAQLLKVTAGSTPIGFIYSLVKSGHVYIIQTGFNYDSIPNLRPGETTHYLAIQWNYDRGFERYDFLGGDSFYKQTLSNSANRLVYLIIQRPRLKLGLENRIKNIARKTNHLLENFPGR